MPVPAVPLRPAPPPPLVASGPLRSVVVVPTYNEARNAAAILKAVMALDGPSVLVVDDGSPDGTAAIVREQMRDFPGRIGLIERRGKLGLGTAYLTGFAAALHGGFEYVCEMDADFSHRPADLPLLIEACRNGADVAVGSRYAGGVRVINWPLERLILSYGAGVYTRLITRMPVQDATAGFVCYRSEVLQRLDLRRVKSTGYAFQIEMKYRAWRAGFKLVEVPIVFTERTEGESKMNGAIVREAARKVWELRLRKELGRL